MRFFFDNRSLLSKSYKYLNVLKKLSELLDLKINPFFPFSKSSRGLLGQSLDKIVCSCILLQLKQIPGSSQRGVKLKYGNFLDNHKY